MTGVRNLSRRQFPVTRRAQHRRRSPVNQTGEWELQLKSWQHDPRESVRPEYGPPTPSKISVPNAASSGVSWPIACPFSHPMSNTKLSHIERAQRRCDVDDLVALAQALRVFPLALLRGGRPPSRGREAGASRVRSRSAAALERIPLGLVAPIPRLPKPVILQMVEVSIGACPSAPHTHPHLSQRKNGKCLLSITRPIARPTADRFGSAFGFLGSPVLVRPESSER